MFNWDEFRNEKVAVWCDTEEKAKEFVEECHKRDMKWEKCTENQTMFDWYKENTCYNYETDVQKNTLMYADKPYYKSNNYKIIKWESEKMKFKVGDWVTGTLEGYHIHNKMVQVVAYATDKLTGKKGYKISYDTFPTYFDDELKLWEEPQTEFTFQEVVARNIPGVYVNKGCERIESVEIDEDGSLTIKADFSGLNELGLGLGVDETIKFKLQEPKKMYVLYEVIHAEKGKEYTFRPKEGYEVVPRDWVVCDTKKGKTFGRVIGSVVKQLTEKEYKQYKECWRA